jgi:hypothetical protein
MQQFRRTGIGEKGERESMLSIPIVCEAGVSVPSASWSQVKRKRKRYNPLPMYNTARSRRRVQKRLRVVGRNFPSRVNGLHSVVVRAQVERPFIRRLWYPKGKIVAGRSFVGHSCNVANGCGVKSSARRRPSGR